MKRKMLPFIDDLKIPYMFDGDTPWFDLDSSVKILGVNLSAIIGEFKHAIKLKHIAKGNQYKAIPAIHESDFYKLVLTSDNPIAQEFADWTANCLADNHEKYPKISEFFDQLGVDIDGGPIN